MFLRIAAIQAICILVPGNDQPLKMPFCLRLGNAVLSPSAWLCACFAGIIDDVYGANFLQGSTDGNVQDENRHGTFVSGVIGGVANNGQGIAGMNQVRQPVQGQVTETY